MLVEPFQFMGYVMKSLRSNDVRVGERYVADIWTMCGKKRSVDGSKDAEEREGGVYVG